MKNEMGYVKKRNALHALLSPCVVRRCGTHRAEDFTVTFGHEARVFDGVYVTKHIMLRNF
jgi:hypothetical protein